MRFISIIFGLLSISLTGCVEKIEEPQAVEISSKTSENRQTISYTISKYDSPYEIQGIQATYVLRANTVQLETDFDKRVRYIGLPDDVLDEVLREIQLTCAAQRAKVQDLEQKADVERRRLNLYFTCG